MKSKILSRKILIILFSCSFVAQADNPAEDAVEINSINEFVNNSKIDLSFRLRSEYVDTDTAKKETFAHTLKSRLTLTTAEVVGFSALLEGDSVVHLNDEFNDKENGNTEYNVVPDQEENQLNQVYIQYAGFDSLVRVGNQRIALDNQRHVGNVAFRQDEATYDAISVSNRALKNTVLFLAVADNRNTITNDNTEEGIILFNAKYTFSPDLSTSAYYYAIQDTNGIKGLDFDTYGVRSTGNVNRFLFAAELATQNKSTASDDFNTLYYHLSAGTKLGAIKATLGYEAFGSDRGRAAFATPLGTNHKFFGWTDVFLSGGDNDGIDDVYASAASMIAGIKVVGQLHNYHTSQNRDPLGSEIGIMLDKSFGSYGAALKLAQYFASDYAEDNLAKADTVKIWLSANAKF